MKNLVLLILFGFLSCKSSQQTIPVIEQQLSISAENCLTDGQCTIELIPQKKVLFKMGSSGALYPELVEGTNTVLKFTYKKNTSKKLQDASYSEIIYAELDNSLPNINLNDADLQTVNLHFGRLCYCKGQTGYYPIKKGLLKIENSKNNTLKIDICFTVDEVPQVLTEIHETISLKTTASN